MTTVLLVAHHGRADAAALCDTAARWLRGRGHRVLMLPDDVGALGVESPDGVLGVDVDAGGVDLAVSLGGDGTMLRTVHLIARAAVPVIGVNLGLLGYLTEVDPADLEDALVRWFAGPDDGRWSIDERMMLEVGVERRDGTAVLGPTTALNEMVIEKQSSGHTVRMLVTIDGTPFTSYTADGLIVATPTGSTAYSLSARGPIVSPRLRAMLVTPVSPHMLFDRSLVLDPGERVDVRVLGHRPAALSIDGRPEAVLADGDMVAVVPSPHVARFVRFGDRRFHQVLTAKFGLPDR